MFIKKIRIQNYRVFNDLEIELNKDLNIIVGANASGKTTLINAINQLNKPKFSVHDFNKHNLTKFEEKYLDTPPEIKISYYIEETYNTLDPDVIIQTSIFQDVVTEEMNSDNKNIKTRKVKLNLIYKLENDLVLSYHEAIKELLSSDNYKKYGDKEKYFLYLDILKKFEGDFKTSYNVCSDAACDCFGHDTEKNKTYVNDQNITFISKNIVSKVFSIDFIAAERNDSEVIQLINKEIKKYTDNSFNIPTQISQAIENKLDNLITELKDLFNKDLKSIGIAHGNFEIKPGVIENIDLTKFYQTFIDYDKFTIPLYLNSLGYNNLVHMYMYLQLKQKQKHNFGECNILCIEEPEAHLHPGMQYNLLKYINNLYSEHKLVQQIFITTHSTSITAATKLDKIIQFQYTDSNNNYINFNKLFEKRHNEHEWLTSFNFLNTYLDATRSDLLFSDKIILVEGNSEKLLIPAFINKLTSTSFENEQISIIEVGGVSFKHFFKLLDNPIKKKILCITDKDYNIFEELIDSANIVDSKQLVNEFTKHKEEYKIKEPSINKCLQKLTYQNTAYKVCTQKNLGSTFENELFYDNWENLEVLKFIFLNLTQKKLQNKLNDIIKTTDDNPFNIKYWEHDNKQSRFVVDYLRVAQVVYDLLNELQLNTSIEELNKILFGAILMRSQSNGNQSKVNFAILMAEKINSGIFNTDKKFKIPEYIEEGIKWLITTKHQ